MAASITSCNGSLPSFSKATLRNMGLLLAALLSPWIFMSLLLVGNADNLWLAEGYHRWAGGARLAQSFFEVNPPLSLLLYALPAEISFRGGVALHQAIFFYTLAVVACASWVLARLLEKISTLDQPARLVTLAAFIIASTLLTTGFFGERDHFVAMALVLLLVTQFIITGQYAADKRFLWAVAFVCGFIILLKPHYLLLPFFMLLYRAVKRRSPSVLWRAGDGGALAAAVALYALILGVFFQDYLTQILPAVVEYYGLHKAYDTMAVMCAQVVGGAALFSLLARVLVKETAIRRFVWWLMIMAVAALIPFIAQGLGYAYHLLPATTLMWMGLGIILYHLVSKQNAKKPVFSLMMAVVLCAVGAYAAKMPQRSFISHAQFAQLPLVQAARQCPQPPCKVFIFGPSFEISYLVSYYAEAQYASRFGALFFLPRHLLGLSGPAQVAHYRGMVADDFKKYQPDVVMLASFEMLRGQGDFDVLDYLKADAGFKQEWQHYQRTGYIEAPFEDYLRDMKDSGETLMRYDIYQRTR